MAEPAWNTGANTATSFGATGRVVTPSDSADLDPVAKAIQVVVAGNLVYVPQNNDPTTGAITVTAAPVGFVPIHRVRRVKATGTTATVVTSD